MSHLLPQNQQLEPAPDFGKAFLWSIVIMFVGYWIGEGMIANTLASIILAVSGWKRGRHRIPWNWWTILVMFALVVTNMWVSGGYAYEILQAGEWGFLSIAISPVLWFPVLYIVGRIRTWRMERISRVLQTSGELAQRDELAGTVPGLFGRDIVVTNPRGATLVIGPPGKGKTKCVIEPTVATASGPTVSASIKWEVFYDTYETRARKGALWALDLGSGIPEGLQRINWSPLSDVRGWDSAGVVAKDWAKPYAQDAKDAHWVESAADWLHVILYAARHRDVVTLSRWCRRGDQSADEIRDEILTAAPSVDDIGASLAVETLDGLLDTPDNERGSILSTLRRMTEVYNSEAILANDGVPFDPREFIHTADTVYIAASTKEQYASAGLVSSLLSSITSAQMEAYNAQEHSGWLSLVMDEVANVAQPPLDEWASQFGGQGIALTAALQDLSQARKKWPGINMLSIFPTKVLMPNIGDDETLRSLTMQAGKFDRTMVTTSSGTSQSTTAFAIPTNTTNENTSVSTQREDILPPEAISQMPMGEAMVWSGGADWRYIRTIPWDDAYWDDYRQAVPRQWRGQVEDDAGTKMLPANADTGEVILHEARVLRDQAEGKHPQHDVRRNEWGR